MSHPQLCLCSTSMKLLQRAEEGIRAPTPPLMELQMMRSWNVGAGNVKLGPLEEQLTLFSSGPRLQPPHI